LHVSLGFGFVFVSVSVLLLSIFYCFTQRRMKEFSRGGGSLPVLSYPLLFSPSPSEAGPLNQLKVGGSAVSSPQWGPIVMSGRKRICCTLKLPESHWWQSF